VEDQHAAARVRVGELHGGKALARKVCSVAARRYVEQVERQRQSRAWNWDGLGERHLRTAMWWLNVLGLFLVCMIPVGAVVADKMLMITLPYVKWEKRDPTKDV
jgi:hypothetical protein